MYTAYQRRYSRGLIQKIDYNPSTHEIPLDDFIFPRVITENIDRWEAETYVLMYNYSRIVLAVIIDVSIKLVVLDNGKVYKAVDSDQIVNSYPSMPIRDLSKFSMKDAKHVGYVKSIKVHDSFFQLPTGLYYSKEQDIYTDGLHNYNLKLNNKDFIEPRIGMYNSIGKDNRFVIATKEGVVCLP